MTRNINEAILTALYENDTRLREVIADHLDIDCPWLVECIADVLANRFSDATLAMVRAIEKNLKPVIEQAAADEMERLEEV